jgi:hypothetical protein
MPSDLPKAVVARRRCLLAMLRPRAGKGSWDGLPHIIQGRLVAIRMARAVNLASDRCNDAQEARFGCLPPPTSERLAAIPGVPKQQKRLGYRGRKSLGRVPFDTRDAFWTGIPSAMSRCTCATAAAYIRWRWASPSRPTPASALTGSRSPPTLSDGSKIEVPSSCSGNVRLRISRLAIAMSKDCGSQPSSRLSSRYNLC